MYARLLELILETEASPPKPYAGIGKVWGDTEVGLLGTLRKRAERALAVEEEFGRWCLLNVDHPLVSDAIMKWKTLTETDVGTAREFRERQPEIYWEFRRTHSAAGE